MTVGRVLVTGATGLVGSHVIERLTSDGWNVRALVRDAARAGALSRAGIELATGDLLDPTSLVVAARNCDLVVHTAAAVTPSGGWEAFQRPNIEGTRNIISAVERAGARLVHVSSVAVYGGAERYSADGRRTDEDTPLAPLPENAFYARSKRESEALVMSAHKDGRIWATAVRPDVIYGRHDRQFVPRIARMLSHGVAPLVAGGESTLAIVHAANVADGVVRAAQHEAAGGRAYNLANDFDCTVREFFRLGGQGMGVRLRMVPVPFFVARAAVGVVKRVAPLVVGDRFDIATSSSLDFITRDNPFSSDRARRELKWEPTVHPRDGVPDAFRWWREHR